MALSEAELELFLLNSSRDWQPGLRRFSHLGQLRRSGRTRTPSLSSPTTPSGASVLQVHFALWHSTSASGAEQACSAAARVASSLPISGVSLRRQLVLRLAYFTRRSPTPKFAACGPSSDVVRSPFFTAYLFLAALPYSRWVLLLGQTDVFPVCGQARPQPSFPVRPLFPV